MPEQVILFKSYGTTVGQALPGLALSQITAFSTKFVI